MFEKLAQFFDFYIVYRVFSIFVYLIFISTLIYNIPDDNFPIFPNLLLFIFVLLAHFISTLSSQHVNSQKVDRKEMISRHILGLIPSLLGIWYLRKLVRFEKNRNNDNLYILSLVIMELFLYVITILFGILIILTLFIAKDIRIIYLLYSFSLGIIGITFGDYLSHFGDRSKSNDGMPNSFTILVNSRRKRLGFLSVFLILALYIAIYSSNNMISPITI